LNPCATGRETDVNGDSLAYVEVYNRLSHHTDWQRDYEGDRECDDVHWRSEPGQDIGHETGLSLIQDRQRV
jgi:hypothetical protein